MNFPDDLLYTKDHEWIRFTGDSARVGITDHAQHELGDIVFLELPSPGRNVSAGEPVAVVESVKSVSDVYAPCTGTITARNENLPAATVNSDPYGEGWLFEMSATERGQLMTADEYRKHVG